MTWRRTLPTLLETDDKVFQISRTPEPRGGRLIYRAWRRVGNVVLLAADCNDDPESRADALEKCKAACHE